MLVHMYKMNPTLAQLAHRAGITVTAELEKFAELLVLECINSVMDGTREGDHYAMRIEQHFNNTQGGILHYGVES